MIVLTLLRLLRDLSGLIATNGAVFTGLLVRADVVTYYIQTDWQLWDESHMLLLSYIVISPIAAVAWYFLQRKEWAMTSRRNLKSRLMRLTLKLSN